MPVSAFSCALSLRPESRSKQSAACKCLLLTPWPRSAFPAHMLAPCPPFLPAPPRPVLPSPPPLVQFIPVVLPPMHLSAPSASHLQHAKRRGCLRHQLLERGPRQLHEPAALRAAARGAGGGARQVEVTGAHEAAGAILLGPEEQGCQPGPRVMCITHTDISSRFCSIHRGSGAYPFWL